MASFGLSGSGQGFGEPFFSGSAAPPLPVLAWCLLFAIAGAAVGSFLALVSLRYPQGEAVAFGRSGCSSCGRTLGPLDLVPILSFAALRGRCRTCNAPIERRYPVIEASAAAIGAASALLIPGWQALAAAVLGWWLLLLAVLDLEHYWLPDRLTYPLILLGLGAAAAFTPALLLHHAAGAALGFLLLWSVATCYRALRGRHGLGGGDAKLFAAAGAWLGWYDLPLVLLGAAGAGLAAALVLHGKGSGFLSKRLPFGTFLAPAIWIVYVGTRA
ncbi:MAG: prepilin peptidase [Pseudomonadota bacterium]|nr:prepilin peptidase [Pseudomonadota bacterium]